MDQLAIWETIRDLQREIADLRTQVQRPLDVGARVYRSTDQSIANNTSTSISFSASRFDTGGFWSAGNPTRLTIPANGIYAVTGHLIWDGSAAGVNLLRIQLNGTTFIAAHRQSPISFSMHMSIATIYQFVANDYLELEVYQNSGGNLDVIATGNMSPEFAIAKIS